MSADISSTRGVSAAETSEALSVADGLDLSTDGELDLSIDGSYVAAGALSPPTCGRARQGISHAKARTCFITASGSASAATWASMRLAPGGGPTPSQKSGPATMPQRPDGSLGPAEPSQTATPGTGPCGQAAAASVWMSTGHS